MLPYSENSPTKTFKCPTNDLVTLLITIQLLHPKSLVGSRKTAVNWTSMPEATINKYCQTYSWKDEVRTSKNGSAPAPSVNPIFSKDAH
jgi:hypothetical protein